MTTIMIQALPLSTLIRRYPYAEDALAWHGIELSELSPSATVHEVVRREGVNGTRLLRDLIDVVDLYGDDEVIWPPVGDEPGRAA